jgi:class 3 adenylate cyclase/dienelactone hydrolase
MAQTRQLAAIMFTDIVGYTKLMEESESSALKLRQRHREVFESVIPEYEGKIINYYGDGTLSIFKSSVNAVRCAVELQKHYGQKPMVPLRIGIHTGDIIITESDIIGDGVNLASRIESLGIAGAVLISDKVVDEIKNQEGLPVKHIGSFQFKNVGKSREVYALKLPGLKVPKAEKIKGKLERRKEPKAHKEPKKQFRKRTFKLSKLIASLFIALLMVTLLSVWYIDRRANIQWAVNEAIPKIEELVKSSWRDYTEAYNLAKDAEKYIPENKRLQELISLTSFKINILTEPEGADVYIKDFKHPEADWEYLGVTPLKNTQLPKGFLRWKLDKPGYETVYAVETTIGEGNWQGKLTKYDLVVPTDFYRTLDEEGKIPSGMTRVTGGQTQSGILKDFFIDRYEVTNEQYKEFIVNGGYQNQKLWKNEFIDNGKVLSWQEAMSLFVDQTGRPGPSTWEVGDYPDGLGDYPVGGISWYEAAAYAEFVGKSLPTYDHWGLARGENTFIINNKVYGGFSLFAPFSNYSNKGPVPVGSLYCMTSYGSFDMAGNVREWCWNETISGRGLRGGAWNGNYYSFGSLAEVPALDRSPTNGFRCAYYPDKNNLPVTAFRTIEERLDTVKYNLEPVADEIYEIYRENFSYDKTELNAEIIETDDSNKDWLEQKIIFDAAYGNEKVSGYLFLPDNAAPPYQVVVYVPGLASFFQPTSDNFTEYYEFPMFLEFVVRTGRAVFYPIYKGTFERSIKSLSIGSESFEWTEVMTQIVKDFKRSIDYLETRDDMNTDKIAFYGMSWGAGQGALIGAVEDRIKTNIYVSGGLGPKVRPEVWSKNFLSRIEVPTIMLNGRYENQIRIKPMYDLIGTRDKKLILFESHHIPPRNDLVREILAWLDQYLGPVERN